MSEARHAFEEHRGEVRLRVFAPTLESLFEEAARALAEIMANATEGPPTDETPVTLTSTDRDALLCDWLNEIVYLSETRKRVFPEARVERVGERDLVAALRGVAPVSLRTPVKAATMHDLFVRPSAEGWEASIVLDV